MWFTFLVLFTQLFCESTTAFFELGVVDGRTLSELWPVLNKTDAFSGEIFQANIASNLSKFGVEFLIAEIGSSNLPRWLTYEPETFNVVGIPLDSDIGSHNMFIVAMQSDNNGSINLLGGQTFDVDVKATRLRSFCSQNVQPITGELLLGVNATLLNGTERLEIYNEFLRIYNVSVNIPILFQESIPSVNTSYDGDHNCTALRNHTMTQSNLMGPSLGIHWVISCGVDSTLNTTLDEMYYRTITLGNGSFAGYPLNGWRVWNSADSIGCPWYQAIRYSTQFPKYLSTSSATTSPLTVSTPDSRTQISVSSVHGYIPSTNHYASVVEPTSTDHHTSVPPLLSDHYGTTMSSLSIFSTTVQGHTLLVRSTTTNHTKQPSDHYESTMSSLSFVSSLNVHTESSSIYNYSLLVQSTTTSHTKLPSVPSDNYEPTLSSLSHSTTVHDSNSTKIINHTSLTQPTSIQTTIFPPSSSLSSLIYHFHTPITTLSSGNGSASPTIHLLSSVSPTVSTPTVLPSFSVSRNRSGGTTATLSSLGLQSSSLSSTVKISSLSERHVLSSPTVVISASYSTVIPRNSPPVVNRTLPKLNITTCEQVFLKIPRDTFLDKEDGDTRNLSLQLLTKNFSELASDSWIHLDSQNQVIYGVPVTTLLLRNFEHAVFEYILSAVDNAGARVNTTLKVTLVDEASDMGQRIYIKADVYLEPRYVIPLELVRLVSRYLYKSDNETIKILNFTIVSGFPDKVEMTWSDCKAVQEICDVRRVEKTEQLLMVSPHVVNPQFMLALVPNFVVRDVSVVKYGPCLNEPPVTTSNVLFVNITCCEVFRSQVPSALFSDSDDGNTRNLSLSFRHTNGSRLNPDLWITFNDKSQDIEGILSFEQAQNVGDEVQEFLLVATDSGKLSANITVYVTIQHPLPSSSYHVTLILKRMAEDDVTQLEELFDIINKLTSYFGDKSTNNVRLLSYREQSPVRVFTWANSSVDAEKVCDHSTIANISSKLKSSAGDVREDFKASMLPDFEVQFVFEEKVGNCKEGANEPPKTLRRVLTLVLNQSLSYFEYLIPADTFQDAEDGDTRNLELTLLSATFEPISKNSWIVLDSGRQMLYGLPNMGIVNRQSLLRFKFVLLAKDSGGKLTTSDVIVEIPAPRHLPNYQITAQLKSYHDHSLPTVDHVLSFLKIVTSFAGGSTDTIDVINYNISTSYPADVVITWTNRSTSVGSCDLESIREEFAIFSDQHGDETTNFANVLLPFYIVQNLHLEFLGFCSVARNNPPVLLNPITYLKALRHRILEFQIPEKMFSDPEDGFTRNLTIFVLDQNNQTLAPDFWILFNMSTQTLYGLATRTVARQQPPDGYVLHIVAMDTDGLSVNTTIVVQIQESKDFSFNYDLKFEVSSTHNYTSPTTEVLDFSWKLERYLASVKDLLFVDYTEENRTFVVSVSTVELTTNNHCKFSVIETLRQLLFFAEMNTSFSELSYSNMSIVENRPNQNLSEEMKPEFLVKQVMELQKGPCSNTPPILLHPLPPFQVSSYGLFSIPIPPKTFHDAEDGYSSNLTITLLTSSGMDLPPDSWLHFNQPLLELYGVITDKVISEKPQSNYSFMLQAIDVYGAKVDTEFSVVVPNTPLDFGFKFNMIFRSNYSLVVSHVDILRNILTKIATYLNDNTTRFLNVISFERGTGFPSTDIVVWGNTTFDSENCDIQRMEEISKKVREPNNEPVSSFREALSPDFQVVLVFEQRQGSCVGSQNSPPETLDSLLVLNITILPSILNYEIPQDVFHDKEDGNTRNLSLSLYDLNMNPVPRNSAVQLNALSQLIYGIFTLNDLNSENFSTRFILVAADSGGKTASTFLQIFLRNSSVPFNYKLEIQFNSYLSTSLSDVAQLLEFQEKLKAFSELRDTHIVDYTRSGGYPTRFVATFINVSLSDREACDHDAITRILDISKNADGSLKQDFLTRFLPAFVVDEVSVQRYGPCNVFWDEAPKLNQEIPRINISVCETWKYQIPPDTFLDKEDGNTRNLTLSVRKTGHSQINSSWISLDIQDQTLYAIPSVKLVTQQPSRGYEFILTATDSHGSSVEIILRIFIFDDILVDSYRLTVSAKIPEIFRDAKSITQTTILFLEAIQLYLNGHITNGMRVIEYTMTSSYVMITWSNCSLGYSPCDYEEIERIRRATIYDRTLPQPKFIQALAPMFILESVVEEMRGPCLNKGPLVNGTIAPLRARLCERLQYKVPDDIFYDSEDGGTGNLKLLLLDSASNSLDKDVWLALDEKAQTIIGYPNIEAQSSQPESGYEFVLVAVDSYGLSARTTIKVLYKKMLMPPSSYEVTLVLQSQVRELMNSVEQQSIILGKLAKYMKDEEQSVRIHSFVRGGLNSTTSFLTWSNCTFPVNSCDVLRISEISGRLKKDGVILEEFREAFLPEFKLQFVFEQRSEPCQKDSNFQPKVLHQLEPIILKKSCGVWTFSIPEGLFYDKEEGYTRNLTLTIKTSDFSEVPTNSWIQLHESEQIIYGFPAIRHNVNSTSETYFLVATDSKEKFGATSLKIIFVMNTSDVAYHVSNEITSFLGNHFPDVYHIRKFMEKLALFLNVTSKSLMVVKYQRTLSSSGSRFLVSWTNCSKPTNSCNHDEIEMLQGKLLNDQKRANQDFLQSLLPYFVPNGVTIEKFGPCLDAGTNAFLKLLTPIRNIFLFSGNLLWYKIPENIFVSNSEIHGISMTLQFRNKTAIPVDFWLQFDNISNILSGVLLVENSLNQSFRLVGQDHYGNIVHDVFQVVVEPKCPKDKVLHQIRMEVEFTGNDNRILVEFLRKLQAFFKPWFRDGNFTIVSWNRLSELGLNYFAISWSHNELICGKCQKNNSFFQEISQKTHSNGTANSEFRSAYLPEFRIVNVTENTCTPGTGTVVDTEKGGQEERWLLYVVPIVVLLTFLLFCFLLFVLRTFLFEYKRREDTVVLEEHPSVASSPRDIHLVRSREVPLANRNRERLTVVNEEFLAFENKAPEILLDSRVSPSTETFRADVEPRVIPTPPLYVEAVSHLGPSSSPTRHEPSTRSSRIEMTELPIRERREAVLLGAEGSPYLSEIDGPTKRSPPKRVSPHLRARSPAIRTFSPDPDGPYGDENDDAWSIFDEDDYVGPTRLRLPTPPGAGMLRLPPVPRPLGTSPSSSLVNTPDRENHSASPFHSPTLAITPTSLSTMNITTYEQPAINTPSDIGIDIARYPDGQTRTPEITSPYRGVFPNNAQRPETPYRTPQSPVGFPVLPERVPYVNTRNSGNPPGSPVPIGVNPHNSQDNIHQVLGELRNTVNKELDRREEVEQYLDYYMNKR